MFDRLTSNPSATPPGWLDLFKGRDAVSSLALGGGVALHALNIYIASTTMPSVIREIGGLDYYAWSTTLFVVASILGAALSSRLLQNAGARAAYATAALIFATGTLVCAFAPSIAALLAGRLVQGLGGGILYALAYAVIRLVFIEPLWQRAIGLTSALWGICTLVGPAIGGAFAEVGHWRLAFGFLVPFALVFAALAASTLPGRTSKSARSSSLPVLQLVLLTGSVIALSFASLRPDAAWGAACSVVALALLAWLWKVEASRPVARLLPAGALSVTTRLGVLYCTIALLMIGMQPEVFVAYFLQVLHGQPPLVAGYLAALMAVGWSIGSMLSAKWQQDKAGSAVLAGPALGVAGLALLVAFMPVVDASWVVTALACVGLALVGLGIGLAWPELVTQVFRAASPREQALAAGAITTVQLFATALGAAAAGVVVNAAGLVDFGGPAGASNAASWLFALFAAAPALALLTARRATRLQQADPHAGVPEDGSTNARGAT